MHLKSQAFTERIEFAQFLHDASELLAMNNWHAFRLETGPDVTTLPLPQREPDEIAVPVIELFLKSSR